MVSKFSRSQSNRTSVGCAVKTSQIHGGTTSQLAGSDVSAADGLVPDTTAQLLKSNEVHALARSVLFWQKLVIMLWMVGVNLFNI